MESRSVRLFATLLLAVLTMQVTLPATAAPTTPQEAATRASAWIKTQQQPDGSFSGFGAGSTADAMLALAAAGENPAALAAGSKTPVDFLTTQASAIAAEPGLAAKTAIALLVSGREPRSSIGVDLIAAIQAGYAADTGQYGVDVTSHALILLALRAAGEEVPDAAIAWLSTVQLDDGSWSFSGERAPGAGDTNTTALVIQALVANGQQESEMLDRAVNYLRTQQNSDGGFPYSQTSQFGNESDANSTAYSIQAIIAAGEDPNSWNKDGATPAARLMAFQNESGAFRYQDAQPDDNQLATYQAVPAILGVTFPLEPLAIILQPEPAESPTALPTATLPLPETGVAQQPATLPNTGRAGAGPLTFIFLAAALALAGVALRVWRASLHR